MTALYLAWYDADRTRPAAAKIADARARFIHKFNRAPTHCLANPADVPTPLQASILGIEVRPNRAIGVNCYWIGRDDEPEATP